MPKLTEPKKKKKIEETKITEPSEEKKKGQKLRLTLTVGPNMYF